MNRASAAATNVAQIARGAMTQAIIAATRSRMNAIRIRNPCTPETENPVARYCTASRCVLTSGLLPAAVAAGAVGRPAAADLAGGHAGGAAVLDLRPRVRGVRADGRVVDLLHPRLGRL